MTARFQHLWFTLWRKVQLLQQEVRLRMRGFTVKKRGRLLIIDGKPRRELLRRQSRVGTTAQRRHINTPRTETRSARDHSWLIHTHFPL